MFVSMVVLFCLHSICAGSLNDLSSDCDEFESCIRMCCNLESEDDFCEVLVASELFESFINLTHASADIKFVKPCEKMELIDDDEWFLEVNALWE